MNNQKQIALALLNYESVYGHFPPAYITDADGNPMHSWRVLILPFLEQQALYDSYNFDEPWDSPANAAVTAQCPYIYQCVEDPANVGSSDTNYLAIVGPNTILAPPSSDMPMEEQRKNSGTKMRDVTDGTSRTVMFTERAATGIHWASPEDIPNNNTISIDSTAHRVGANLTFADGHIEFQVNNDPNQISLQSMATINDGR
jgi:prepilin-type processing-associated H-X9-DG protein